MQVEFNRILTKGITATVLFALAATSALAAEQALKSFSCDTMDGVITASGVSVDSNDSKEGKGSLKVESASEKPVVFRLFEVDKLNTDNGKLLYRAKVKTKDVKGKAYLEMWCHVGDKGEFFSRGLDQTLSGTNAWTTEEIPFFLKKGQKADRVKLNLVVEGGGTAWIDDIQLVKADM